MAKKKATKKKIVKDKELFQFCLFETYVNEVLDLPKQVQIDEIIFDIGFSLKRVTTQVPLELAKLGVSYLREPSTSMEAQGTLSGTRKSMEECAVKICDILKLDYRHMKVRRMVVSYKNATSRFTAMTKKMEGDEGTVKNHRVLGLVVTEGTEASANDLIKILGARKIHCKYSVQPVRTVICST